MQIAQRQRYTPEQYLELEAAADYKSEYIGVFRNWYANVHDEHFTLLLPRLPLLPKAY